MIWIVLIFVAIFLVIIGIIVSASSDNNDGLGFVGLIIICAGLVLMVYAGYSIGEQHGARKQMRGGYKIEYVTDTNGVVTDTIIHTTGY